MEKPGTWFTAEIAGDVADISCDRVGILVANKRRIVTFCPGAVIFRSGWTLPMRGVVLGVVLAVILQASAAKWFIKHLQAIANTLGRPELEGDLEQLRQRLVMTTLSAYSSGAISMVVLAVAIVFGLAAYVIGLMFTLPIAFMIIAPLWVTSSVLYFLMLFSYERSLSSLRQAVRLQAGLSRD